MTRIPAFVRRHPVATYFALTFAISWGGVLAVIGGPAGMTGVKAQDSQLFPLALLAMLAGPSLSGVLMTALVDGRAGLRTLRVRLRRWRVQAGWYAVALLAAPLIGIVATGMLAPFSPGLRPALAGAPDPLTLLSFGLAVGAAAGIFEELGWTGFAIPRLRARYGLFRTGLTVGLLWSAWHVLVVVWGMGDRAGTVPLALFVIVDGLAGLPAFRTLMVLVHDRTDSVCLTMLMHVSLTTTTLTVTPPAAGWTLLSYGLVFAFVTWCAVAAIAAASTRHRPSHPRRTAAGAAAGEPV